MKNSQFLRFLVAGGTAAVVNYGSRFVWSLFMPFWAAVIVAYACGIVTAFVLSKLFVFTDSVHSTQRSAVYFVLVNLVAAAQTWVISLVLVNWMPEWFAHGVGVAFPVFTSYIGHKRFSFRSA